MEFKDYYKILGVDRKADQKAISQAFRKLARQHHPDVNPGNKQAEARFKDINEAHQVLSDPDKRAKYDQVLELREQMLHDSTVEPETEVQVVATTAVVGHRQIEAPTRVAGR